MMQAFRNSAKLIAVVFGVLLVFWLLGELSGLSSGGLFSGNKVGVINGEGVDTRIYEEQVSNAIEQQRRESATPLSLEDIQTIRDQVWEQFIQNRILQQEMERYHITVAADEVAEAIRYSPPQEFLQDSAFMASMSTGGQFDPAKYEAWLNSATGQSVVPYLEARFRDEIRQAKLWRVVTADVFLSDAALWQKFRDENEKVRIRLAAIVPRTVVPDSAAPVTDAEVEAYYREHREEFERPRTAFLSYVALPRLLNAQDSAAALARAEAIRAEIADGAPFDEVARRESADSISAANGGDLGEWGRGDMVPSFDSAAFALPLNSLSPPVLSQFGYHIIQVTGRTGTRVKGRHILIPIELAGAHRDLLDAQADSLEALGAERLDPAALDTVARALGLQIRRADPVQQGSRVQLGRFLVPDAGVWAFQAQAGETSAIIEIPEAFFLFRLDSAQAAGVPPLAEIRDAVELAVRDQKKWVRAREIARELARRVGEGSPLAQAADALRLPRQEFGPFARISPPLPNPALVGTAFSLAQGEVSGVLDTEEGLYLVEMLERTPADSGVFSRNLEELRVQAIRDARSNRIRNYLASLRASADVTDNRAQLSRTSAQIEAEAERIRQQTGGTGLN